MFDIVNVNLFEQNILLYTGGWLKAETYVNIDIINYINCALLTAALLLLALLRLIDYF